MSATATAGPTIAAGDREELNDLLAETATYVELMGESALAGTPLTPSSSRILISVRAEPGITIAELARRTPRTQQAISQLVARLERLGLIERRLGAGRGVGLHLTAAGEAMAAEGLACEAELRSRVRGLLGDERHRELERLLRDARDVLRGAR